MNCPFCATEKLAVIAGNELAFAIRDLNPVTLLHSLVLSRRHLPDYFDLDRKEVAAIDEVLGQLSNHILADDKAVEGFNIGISVVWLPGRQSFTAMFI